MNSTLSLSTDSFPNPNRDQTISGVPFNPLTITNVGEMYEKLTGLVELMRTQWDLSISRIPSRISKEAQFYINANGYALHPWPLLEVTKTPPSHKESWTFRHTIQRYSEWEPCDVEATLTWHIQHELKNAFDVGGYRLTYPNPLTREVYLSIRIATNEAEDPNAGGDGDESITLEGEIIIRAIDCIPTLESRTTPTNDVTY